MAEFRVGDEIHGPEDLEKLPSGARIEDSGMFAVKRLGGAWQYEWDGQFWEPEVFPCRIVGLPAAS